MMPNCVNVVFKDSLYLFSKVNFKEMKLLQRLELVINHDESWNLTQMSYKMGLNVSTHLKRI